ncbi:hypothetical protein LMG28727_06891 [Paraburkholderia kirstenboschensis]|nr:hypothetical protein LMG28727_06891 [Paraburkholderia kirstenboschensis]
MVVEVERILSTASQLMARQACNASDIARRLADIRFVLANMVD